MQTCQQRTKQSLFNDDSLSIQLATSLLITLPPARTKRKMLSVHVSYSQNYTFLSPFTFHLFPAQSFPQYMCITIFSLPFTSPPLLPRVSISHIKLLQTLETKSYTRQRKSNRAALKTLLDYPSS